MRLLWRIAARWNALRARRAYAAAAVFQARAEKFFRRIKGLSK
jgi:hypothetical protein